MLRDNFPPFFHLVGWKNTLCIVLIICKVLKRLMILSSFTPMKWNIKVIFHGFGRVGANDWSADKSVTYLLM